MRKPSTSEEAEPEIYATTERFGTIIENMIFDQKLLSRFRRRQPNRKHALGIPWKLPNASSTAPCGHQKHHHADPRCARRPSNRTPDTAQAISLPLWLHVKVAGTERGVTGRAVLTCFGAPFMPRRPRIRPTASRRCPIRQPAGCQHRIRWCLWLARMPIKATRALLTAALDAR